MTAVPSALRPAAYNPSTCGPITTSYGGPQKRPIPHDEGVWYRKYQTWRDASGHVVGAWRWTQARP